MSVEQLKVMKERTDLEINLLQDSLSNMLDKTTPHVLRRWIGCFVVACIYVLRVYLVQGFYIVSYGLGIYILNLLIGFLSPQVDPKIHDAPPSPPEDPMSSVLWFAASLSSSSGIMWKGEHS